MCVCESVCGFRGLKQSEAELCFLNTARNLELYGVELHDAMVMFKKCLFLLIKGRNTFNFVFKLIFIGSLVAEFDES